MSNVSLKMSTCVVVCAGILLARNGLAQTPVILPNTITSIAGNTPTSSTVNAACSTNPQFTAQDALGNGCPAVNAVFGGNERSMTVDPQGNIYVIADSSNPQTVRRIDARTGNITIFAGAGSGNACQSPGVSVLGNTYTQTDKVGDGCPVSFSGGFNAGRGLGSDAYGNIIIGVTGDYALHFVCTAVSPMCTAAQVRVNLMRNIAGCTTSATGYGTAVAGATVGTAGDGGPATQFSLTQYGGTTCSTGISAARQSVGDQWDNIYFTDNSNSRIRVVLGAPSVVFNGSTLANPLYAVLQTSTTAPLNYATPVQGNIYPIAGGGTACSAKTDAGGDGCPFYNTLVNSTTYVQGITVTPEGDFLFADGFGRLRTIYMGGTAIRSALAANGVGTPQIGFSYALLGNGATNLYYNSALPGVFLGSTVSLQANSTQRLAVDTAGNIYIGDQAQVLFYDIYTGYVRRLGGGTGATVCNTSALGDGCPIAQSKFGAANSILSLNLDNLGNLYLQDLQNKLVRRVTAATLPAAAVNSSVSSSVVVHAPAAGSTVAVAAGTSGSNTEFTVGAASCAAANGDNSVDCTAPVTFQPSQLAQRNDPLAISTTVGSATTSRTTELVGVATGSALVFDPASAPATTRLGSTATGNTTVVLDGNGNAYVSGTQGISKISGANGSTVTNITAASTTYLAVDAQSNVYATNGGAAGITKFLWNASAGTYTASNLPIPTIPINGSATQGYSGPMAVDANGVVYIADQTNKQVIKFSQATGVGQQLTQTALSAPTAMTQDAYGNLLVVDGTSVLKVPAAGFAVTAGSPVATPAVTFPSALTAPASVAVDQGENIYVADSGHIVALSLSGYQYTIPGISGSAVAVDGAGNLYTASTAVAGVTEVSRNAEAFNFGTNVSTPYVGVFLNAGATSSTGFNQSDTGGNFSALAPASPLAASGPTCNLSSTALAGGALCNTSLQFAPTATGSGVVQDVITLLPAANTIGALSLSGTKNGSTATTMTAITGNTSGLVYTTGTETTFTVTVTQSTGTPAGNVSVSIDGGAAMTYPLTGATASTATATVPVSGLSAGTHSIAATYAGSSGIAGSTATPVSFSVAPAGTTLSWTPSSTTQQYSAAIGAGVLNATAKSGGANVPGNVIYSATPSGASAFPIHSASFLPVGTYSLSATFVPNDAVDYVGSSATIASYSVTQASTTAALGSSQMLVAADGSGNYSSVQAAVNALPATGGSVYIKPGTYPGFLTVATPNVALHGLGGNAAGVTLTNEAGAFSPPYLPGQGPGNNAHTGDEGSATLVVAKDTVNGIAGTPNGFYAENLSIVNTYNTDTTNTTTNAVVGGACTANQPAQSFSALYNAGTECNSQALAVWITADLAVLNNVYTTSLQDTIYAGSQGTGSAGTVPARQYWFRGKVTGDVDYIFGDAAAVFDYSTIYTMYHGNTASGTETIEAQNKMHQTGGIGDYLSGYVMNSNVFTSQSSGMTNLFLGRPYGPYSTWLMLNSYIDQVSPTGYIEFSGDTNLPSSTYAEFNDIPYTDPATGSPDVNGVPYLGAGGSSGAGVTGTRETTSQDPGSPAANNAIKTTLTQAQAQPYFPANFLGTAVASALSPVSSWNPNAAIAVGVNGFVPTGSSATVAGGTSVSILMRPRTPGLGAVGNGTYTIPTGTYVLTDAFNGSTTQLASGALDAAGEAYFVTSTLAGGVHNLSWTYGGDANFAGSTSPSTYVLTVSPIATTTTLSSLASSVTYGQSATIMATVNPASGSSSAGGTVTLTTDGGATQTATLSGGMATFTVTGLNAGSHSFSASYAGNSNFGASSSASSLPLTVNQAVLTVTAIAANRSFGQSNLLSVSLAGFQYTDSVATVFTSAPMAATSAMRNSPVGSYTATPLPASLALTAFGSTNYTVQTMPTTFNINGGAAQIILFAPLPNFLHGGTYQLSARTTSGLPVTYTVTSGSASVSGATLTVTGTGPVTVQASRPPDASGNYAAAMPVSQSFTAQ